ncbi:hypothetical protein [Microbulbifer sp. SSSA005]|uniref:hypothetical protein n=1 Tax=Microbulbifer sp. SSSA005 TaxID=3243378 RepID=UPI00403A46F4
MRKQELEKIKNKNVQQQNELTFLVMKETADAFVQSQDRYPWLLTLLEQKGLSPSCGILIEVSSLPEQAGNEWFGTWLTSNKSFFKFAVITDRQNREIIDIDEWLEYSPPINKHCPGIGKTDAFIAIELLEMYKKG